ncbi:MAG: hypothetical protein ACTSPP_06930 [Candidatus Heimdallarchaeaceae archaeon]
MGGGGVGPLGGPTASAILEAKAKLQKAPVQQSSAPGPGPMGGGGVGPLGGPTASAILEAKAKLKIIKKRENKLHKHQDLFLHNKLYFQKLKLLSKEDLNEWKNQMK